MEKSSVCDKILFFFYFLMVVVFTKTHKKHLLFKMMLNMEHEWAHMFSS